MNDKLISTLKTVGFSQNQAKVLDYLLAQNKWPIQSRDIERAADMRQNAVSPVLRGFVENGWLKETRAPSEKRRGKPASLYTINISRPKLLLYVEKIIESRVDAINNTLSEEARAIILGADA